MNIINLAVAGGGFMASQEKLINIPENKQKIKDSIIIWEFPLRDAGFWERFFEIKAPGIETKLENIEIFKELFKNPEFLEKARKK